MNFDSMCARVLSSVDTAQQSMDACLKSVTEVLANDIYIGTLDDKDAYGVLKCMLQRIIATHNEHEQNEALRWNSRELLSTPTRVPIPYLALFIAAREDIIYVTGGDLGGREGIAVYCNETGCYDMQKKALFSVVDRYHFYPTDYYLDKFKRALNDIVPRRERQDIKLVH